jgi:hypothetical protein
LAPVEGAFGIGSSAVQAVPEKRLVYVSITIKYNILCMVFPLAMVVLQAACIVRVWAAVCNALRRLLNNGTAFADT